MNLLFRTAARLFTAVGLAIGLSACGGGGGGGGASLAVDEPPGTAATLQQSAAEAQAAVVATVTGGSIVVAQGAGLDSSFLIVGSPLGGGASPINMAGRVASAAREQPMAVASVGCAQTGIFEPTPPCTGNVTVDENIPTNGAVVWPAGTYISMNFNALQGTVTGGGTLSLSGAVRLDYLTSIDTTATSFANVQIRITTSNLSGSVDGVEFGPDSGVALLDFDSAGVGSVTVNGLRITNLEGLSVTDAHNYQLLSVALRAAYGSAASAAADTIFESWIVAGARPQLNSTAQVTSGSASAAISVRNSSSTTVVYDVVLTVDGRSVIYTVTATYPPGGGAPTYAVTEPV